MVVGVDHSNYYVKQLKQMTVGEDQGKYWVKYFEKQWPWVKVKVPTGSNTWKKWLGEGKGNKWLWANGKEPLHQTVHKIDYGWTSSYLLSQIVQTNCWQMSR